MSTELRDLIREVMDDHPRADPRELARHVAKLTPKADVMTFYEDTLVDYVSSMLRTERNTALDAARPKGNYSKKLQRCRDGWKALCASRVHIGQTQWKLLGDCTVDELEFCASERRENATENIRRAEEYERYAELMREHRAKKFRDLPPEAVM
jgi:hypothetical protein